MVVNDIDLRHQPDRPMSNQAFCGIVLHELAHVLMRPVPFKPRPDAEPAKIVFESLVIGHAVATEPPVMPRSSRLPATKPVSSASPSTCGIGRTGRHACSACFCYFAGNQYGLSHPNRYREAIGDEPARLADMSIRNILDTPYPEAFWRLWTTDLARWHSDCSPNPQRSTDHVYRYLD